MICPLWLLRPLHRSGPWPVCLLTLALACGLYAPSSAWADWVVIAHPESGVTHLSRDEVVNIYMGRYRRLPSGRSAIPVDLPAAHPGRADFYLLLTGKSLAEINSYWARLLFSGQSSPPLQLGSEEDVLKIVSENRGAIGYIDKRKLNQRVKVVFDPS